MLKGLRLAVIFYGTCRIVSLSLLSWFAADMRTLFKLSNRLAQVSGHSFFLAQVSGQSFFLAQVSGHSFFFKNVVQVLQSPYW